MKNKIIAFGASNSRNSINQQLASYSAFQIENAEVEILDLNEYEMPIYSIDREIENGIPALAKQFKEKLKEADGIIISFAEHNGAYSVAFKNVMDWMSRINNNVWENKPMFLMATSPGKRGGQTVLDIAVRSFGFMNTNTIVHFSLPSFQENYSLQSGIVDEALKQEFTQQLKAFDIAVRKSKQVIITA